MKIEKYDGVQDREIVAGLIYSETVLGKAIPVWKPDYAKPQVAIVAQLCLDYYERYKKPPGNKAIKRLVVAWSDKQERDAATIELVERLINGVLDEYPDIHELNSEHAVDVLGRYLNKAKIKATLDLAKGHLQSGRVEDAGQCLSTYSKVEVGAGAGSHLLLDRAEVLSTFEEKQEAIIRYPGDLGKFFGDSLARDSFLAFVAPEGTGKTFWLMDIAWRAMLQHRKVAFFEVGDMSRKQINRRFLTRAAKHPWFPGKVLWPTGINPKGITSKTLEFTTRLSGERAWEACQDVMQHRIKADKSYLWLETHANSTINVAGVRSSLQNMEREGFLADVVIIDYADILAPPSGKLEVRDQINLTWKQLRSMSQDLHACVVTATQANRQAYTSPGVRREHTSEDKRKLSHVTGMIGISVSDTDKEQGMMRLNWLKAREMEFYPNQYCYVASCLALANPAVLSYFKTKREEREAEGQNG